MNAVLRWMRRQVAPLLVFVIFIGGWEAIIRGFQVESFLVPAPSAVIVALVRGFAEGGWLGHAAVTGFQAMSFLSIHTLTAGASTVAPLSV